MELYCHYILAFQRYARQFDPSVELPLAIMTSGVAWQKAGRRLSGQDTNAKTMELLEAKNYFGLRDLASQVEIACKTRNTRGRCSNMLKNE